MRFSWRHCLAIFAAAALATGCGSSDDAADAEQGPGVSGPQATIAFVGEPQVLTLAPGDQHTVKIATQPPDHYAISFDLLGTALDASLDRATTVADGQGQAEVQLHAPNGATTFRLRATVQDGPAAELPISVSDKGFGNVRVVPVYKGNRTYYTEWTADIVAKTTCADLASLLPTDPQGAITVSSPKGKESELVAQNAPVGPNLAVALRAEHFMWGCSDATGLIAGETLDVPVNVIDKPMDLTKTDLDVTFTFTPDPTAYAQLVDETATLLADAFLPTDVPESQTVLDAMQAAAADPNAFAQARAANGWNATTNGYFSTLSLRDTCKILAKEGLGAQPGKVVGHLAAAGTADGHAVLDVTQLGYVDAMSAGIPPQRIVNWSADANDTVVLLGSVAFVPSRYAGAAMLKPVKDLIPTATGVDAAFVEIAACPVLAATLGGYPGCDVTCMTTLCGTAIDARWSAALDASTLTGLGGEVDLQVAAQAIVDDIAAPASFSGTWKGTLSDGVTAAAIKGDAVGSATAAAQTPPQ